MRAMAQEAKVALQAVSDARKAEEEISKKKHQLNQEYDKKKSRSIKDMKESAKSSITSCVSLAPLVFDCQQEVGEI